MSIRANHFHLVPIGDGYDIPLLRFFKHEQRRLRSNQHLNKCTLAITPARNIPTRIRIASQGPIRLDAKLSLKVVSVCSIHRKIIHHRFKEDQRWSRDRSQQGGVVAAGPRGPHGARRLRRRELSGCRALSAAPAAPPPPRSPPRSGGSS